mgnify:CR=1 FL=1
MPGKAAQKKLLRWAPEVVTDVIEFEKADKWEAWGDAPMDSRRNNNVLDMLREPGMTFMEAVRALDISEGGEGLDVLPGKRDVPRQLTWGELMASGGRNA